MRALGGEGTINALHHKLCREISMRLQSVKAQDVAANQDMPSPNPASVTMENELRQLGLTGLASVHVNLSPARLYEQALRRKEVQLSADGAIVAKTGQHTGRSPNDKYVVRDATNASEIDWGKVNQPYENANFNALKG